jgi:CBS domain-containing protein
MTWVVVTTEPDKSVAHAALIMTERRVGSLPVVDNGKLVGMLTERDVLRALGRGGSAPQFAPEGFLW